MTRSTLLLTLVCAALLLGQPGPALAQTDTPALYQASYDHEARGELASALSAHEKIPKTERGTYLFALRQGWLLYLNARYTESVSAYQRARSRAPHAVEPVLGMLLPQLALRQWRAAEETAHSALAIDPLNATALRRLAFALFNQGRFDEAQVLYRKVLDLYPSDLEVLLGVGWCELRRGHAKEAQHAFQRVLSISPRNPSAKDGLATARGASN